MGRQPKPINWDFVEKCMEAGCTATQIAGSLHINIDTFSDRFKNEYGRYFSDLSGEFRSGGLGNIQARQYLKAMEGNPTMLLHLGKHWLGQKDSIDELQNTPEVLAKFDALMRLMGGSQSSDLNIADNNNNEAQKS